MDTIGGVDVDLCVKMNGNCPVTPIIGRRMRDFRRTCKGFSEEKQSVLMNSGFGCLFTFRCSELNIPLCYYMCKNFDVEKSLIKIHGRHLAVNVLDLKHVLGLSDGGSDVEFCSSCDDTLMLDWKARLWGGEENMTLDVLAKKVFTSKTADDAFLVSFCLYALSTMIMPSESDIVDPRLLAPLNDPKKISTYNWASFAFRHLVDGIRRYQTCVSSPVYSCVAFLQLFYLDTLIMKAIYVNRFAPPVMCWTNKSARIMFGQTERAGGFEDGSTYVSKKWSGCSQYKPGGSEDCSTGLKTTVVEDLARVTKVVEELKVQINQVRSTFSEMHPDMIVLREAIITLQQLVQQLTDEGIDNIVCDVVKEVIEEEAEYKDLVTAEGTNSVCTSSPTAAYNDGPDTVSLVEYLIFPGQVIVVPHLKMKQ